MNDIITNIPLGKLAVIPGNVRKTRDKAFIDERGSHGQGENDEKVDRVGWTSLTEREEKHGAFPRRLRNRRRAWLVVA